VERQMNPNAGRSASPDRSEGTEDGF